MQRGRTALAIMLAAVLLLTVFVAVWQLRNDIEWWLLGAGAILAFFGLVFIFGYSGGIIHFGRTGKERADPSLMHAL